MNKFIIFARRSNCETVYYCNNPTQGARMVVNAYSVARRFDSVESAEMVLNDLKNYWLGLDSWSVEMVAE
jgi:hypothetical protein